jgi:hypothetical protein
LVSLSQSLSELVIVIVEKSARGSIDVVALTLSRRGGRQGGGKPEGSLPHVVQLIMAGKRIRTPHIGIVSFSLTH